MRLCEYELEEIKKRQSEKSKAFYAPIVNGFIEMATYKYMEQAEFNYFTLPELSVRYFEKRGEINFKFKGASLELDASNAMRLSALSAIYGKVFSVSRAFRCENNTNKTHLSEFKIFEAEWQESREDRLFLFIENYLEFIVKEYNQYVVDKKLTSVFSKIDMKFPIARITYDDVLCKLERSQTPLHRDDDGYIDFDISNFITEPCFITYYPKKFSWRAKGKNDRLSYSYNLVLPNGYGELADFSIRETQRQYYAEKFKNAEISDYYEWYLSGMESDESPRVGFGLGLERLCSWLMQLDNIEDQLCFPRKSCILDREDL